MESESEVENHIETIASNIDAVADKIQNLTEATDRVSDSIDSFTTNTRTPPLIVTQIAHYVGVLANEPFVPSEHHKAEWGDKYTKRPVHDVDFETADYYIDFKDVVLPGGAESDGLFDHIDKHVRRLGRRPHAVFFLKKHSLGALVLDRDPSDEKAKRIVEDSHDEFVEDSHDKIKNERLGFALSDLHNLLKHPPVWLDTSRVYLDYISPYVYMRNVEAPRLSAIKRKRSEETKIDTLGTEDEDPISFK